MNKENKPTPGILKNKYYLYMTEFFSGMSVMAVELGASRLLSPYFSSSQIVWTIIIGTIMIAMALGNIYGGRSADKNPNPDILYKRVLIAGIWTALIPVLGKYLIVGISALVVLSVNEAYLVWAAFASCIIIFVYPLFLLGTVTPSLVKYSVDSLDDSGKTVGYLGAFNTTGSIIGTFLPTFVTIPAVGTSITFLIFASLLIAIAVIYFISERKGYVKSGIGLALLLVGFIFGRSDSFAFWNKNLTYEGESIYNYLQVSDSAEQTIFSTNVLFGVQSMRRKDGKLTGMYYDYAMAAPLMTDAVNKDKMDILVLGNGTGTYASQCKKYFANANIDGVEIDGKITKLAKEYFEMPDDVNVTTYDGRAYLHAIDKKYDVILVDAYQDISVPFQMSSTEFFTEVKNHLNPDGVMVINMNMRGSGEGSINDYLADTISRVFKNEYTVDITNNTNRELFASDDDSIIEKLENNIANISDDELKSFMSIATSELIKYEPGNYVLTDDKAPVEVLSMRALDGIINDEVDYYKKLYKEKGLKGIIDGV